MPRRVGAVTYRLWTESYECRLLLCYCLIVNHDKALQKSSFAVEWRYFLSKNSTTSFETIVSSVSPLLTPYSFFCSVFLPGESPLGCVLCTNSQFCLHFYRPLPSPIDFFCICTHVKSNQVWKPTGAETLKAQSSETIPPKPV